MSCKKFLIRLCYILLAAIFVVLYAEAKRLNIVFANDVSKFLGPALGEAVSLLHYEDASALVERRICTSISEDGIYTIEKRIRLPESDVTFAEISEFSLSTEDTTILQGKKDYVLKYTLQAKNGKIIKTSLDFKSNDGVVLDLVNRRWSKQLITRSNKINIDSRILKEEIKILQGRIRKLIYVENFFKYENKELESYKSVDVFATGLGIIRREVVSSDSEPHVLFRLQE